MKSLGWAAPRAEQKGFRIIQLWAIDSRLKLS